MHFITNGAKTFRDAASGVYNAESDSVKEIRREIFDDHKSDLDHLRSDSKKIGGDVQNSFNKIILGNV